MHGRDNMPALADASLGHATQSRQFRNSASATGGRSLHCPTHPFVRHRGGRYGFSAARQGRCLRSSANLSVAHLRIRLTPPRDAAYNECTSLLGVRRKAGATGAMKQATQTVRRRKRSRDTSPASRDDKPQAPRRRPRYARWRALSLSLVYLVFALHILHWKLTGKTLAPLELNEVMYTLELGIITAGFLFMSSLVLGTLIFGRIFCSWACHIMVLQDGCAWILRKLGIVAKPIRSRLLLWVPPLTAAYMFIWPQILRAMRDGAFPTFHFRTDTEGWASFVTNNFWRNLPGPWIIVLTFVVCGFVMVYVMGSRTFCTYVCPYGAIFALADRFSPARIRLTGDCVQCGTCTATCTSAVRVHEDIKAHGMVVNPACLKDLDCVSACPQNALQYGFKRPALFKSYATGGRFGLPYTFTLGEELLAALVFLTVLLSFRSLYSRMPFLLSLTMGAIIGYLTILFVRLFSSSALKLAHLSLKRNGKLTTAGVVFGAVFALIAALVGHSAFVRYHEYNGLRQATALRTEADAETRDELARSAHAHLLSADRWGLIANERVERSLVRTSVHLNEPATLETYADRFLNRHPQDIEIRLYRGRGLLASGKHDAARRAFIDIVQPYADQTMQVPPVVASAHQSLAGLFAQQSDYDAAINELTRALQIAPERGDLHADLGGALAEVGRLDDAIGHLHRAVELDSMLGRAAYNLGTLLAHQGRFPEAIPHYRSAVSNMSPDADVHNNLGYALQQTGKHDVAEKEFDRALAIDTNHADAHFNLGVLLLRSDRTTQADVHLREAARLEPRYARLLQGS